MEWNPVGWFEIHVRDMERARGFYQAVFQVTLERIEFPGSEMWSFPMVEDRPGCAGALVQAEGAPVGSGGTRIYFSSPDCALEAGRVSGAGGRVLLGKTSIGPYGFVALAEDTEGNVIGIHSRA
jgi:hypothetical protein